MRDVVVGYCSVTVYFDPLRVDPEWLEKELLDAATATGPTTVEYGSERRRACGLRRTFGPDIEDVARFAGCTTEEVVARHAAVTYRVYLVGFVPGFAYMAERGPSYRRAAPGHAAHGGARRVGRDRRRADRHLSRRRRPAAGTSSAARRCGLSTRLERSRRSSKPATRCVFVRSPRPTSRGSLRIVTAILEP